MKNKIIFIIIILLVFMILLIPLKGSYAFYSDNKDLNIINTKIGNWKTLIGYLRMNDKNNKLTKEIKGDLYRYFGTNTEEPNNYICLDSSNCDINSNNLYRIIGITKDNNLKVIKNTSLPNAYQWHNDNIIDTSWDNSTLFDALNGSEFLNSEEYLTNELKEKILNIEWNIGDVAVPLLGLETFNKEVLKKSIPAQIGLMYLSDYYYAVSEDGNVQCWNTFTDACKNNWLHISNNGNVLDVSRNEWTMTRHSLYKGIYNANRICNDGYIDTTCIGLVDAEYYVRPVFFLTSDIELSGEGTKDDPFIIKI